MVEVEEEEESQAEYQRNQWCKVRLEYPVPWVLRVQAKASLVTVTVRVSLEFAFRRHIGNQSVRIGESGPVDLDGACGIAQSACLVVSLMESRGLRKTSETLQVTKEGYLLCECGSATGCALPGHLANEVALAVSTTAGALLRLSPCPAEQQLCAKAEVGGA